MKKLFFIYDSLMIKRMQFLLGIPIKFLSYGYIHAKMYFLNDGKKKRYFFIKANGRCVYGAIFVIDDYEAYKNAISAFYSNTEEFTTIPCPIDLYVKTTVEVTPITFNSIEDFERVNFNRAEPIECNSFCGKPTNKKVMHSIDKSAYYGVRNGVDAVSFLKLIKENNLKEETE